ncbi:hypothetical protein [Planctomyces sp. SH-PL62]|uniref:hypothetical protein n=1 Tax=Planctomyces sp. SH-PL62 TaxID=1636152 RepID=UPI00078CB6D2|nr:hypothetical protein [Planctomyces sp. SH-PL62]AMV37698.1 hypothetical protein VT85_09695 [Planctomyces sp. SH-PL62]
MITTQSSTPRPRRLRAAIIGFGLDGGDDQQRLTRSAQCLVVGGSAETHDAMREAVTRIELELEAMQCELGDLDPDDLAELAFRVDLPELHHLAVRLEDGLERQGRDFMDLSAEELGALLDLEDSEAAVGS